MHEEAIKIRSSDDVALEAMLVWGRSEHGAVLCHPHPLYGGAMDNNVVLAARDALAALGMTTLRFNFRGVGGSGGAFDGGRGEQQDLLAAYAALAEDVDIVHIVAYSFGAWVATTALARGTIEPRTVTLISPPVAFAETDFSGLTLPSCPTLVVSGDSDQFGPKAEVDRWIRSLGERDDITRVSLAGVDHFYWGAEPALAAALTEFYEALV